MSVTVSELLVGGAQPVLYGASPEAGVLADCILERLGQLEEGDVLIVDLSKVVVIDVGFTRAVYLRLCGGDTERGHRELCERRKGVGLLFTHVSAHLPNLVAATNLEKDVLVWLDDRGRLEIEGSAFGERAQRAYAALTSTGGGLTSRQLLRILRAEGQVRGTTLGNCSNLLKRLYTWGLAYRRKADKVGGGIEFFYHPVDFVEQVKRHELASTA